MVRVSGFLLGFCFVLILTRSLGVGVMGNYAITITVLNLLSVFGRLGQDTSTLRYISHYFAFNKTNVSGGIYIQSFCIILFTSIVISVLSRFVLVYQDIYQLNDELQGYLLIGIWAIPAISLNALNAQVFRAMRKPALFTFFKFDAVLLLNILGLSIGIYLLGLDVNPVLILLISVCITIVINTSLIIGSLNLFKNKTYWYSRGLFNKKVIQTGVPMLFADATTFLMSWVDILMLGYFCTSEEVGVYNVAMKVSSFTGVSLFAVNSISTPKFSQYYNSGDFDRFKSAVAESTRLIFLTTLPLVVFMLLFSRQIVNLFIGDSSIYLKDLGSQIVIILGVGLLISALSGSVGNIMNMTGKQTSFRNVILLTLIIKIMLNIFLISSWGVTGAAYSSAFGTIFWNILCVLLIYRFYKIYTVYIPKINSW